MCLHYSSTFIHVCAYLAFKTHRHSFINVDDGTFVKTEKIKLKQDGKMVKPGQNPDGSGIHIAGCNSNGN